MCPSTCCVVLYTCQKQEVSVRLRVLGRPMGISGQVAETAVSSMLAVRLIPYKVQAARLAQ
jgi:hypothetical protein